MELLDKIAAQFGFVSGKKVQELEKAATERAITLISSMNVGSAFGTTLTASDKTYAQLVDAYRSWVYTAIDRIAKSVAVLKLKVYVYRASGSRAKVVLPWSLRRDIKEAPTEGRRKKYLVEKGLIREELTDHASLELLANPNGLMTRFMLWYETMVRMELSGSCGWYIPRGMLGVPGEIWPLPLTRSATLSPRISGKVEILGWNYRDGDVMEVISPDEMVFHKYPHPGSPFKGMSPLLAQTEPYDIDLFLSQQQSYLFQNRAVIGLNLHTDQNWTPDQAKEMKEFLDEQYAGVTKSGSNLVTHSGLKTEKMGQTNRDALVAQVAKYSREKLITSFDLSEGKLGLVSDVNRANMEALNETFVNDCLRPKTMILEENIEARFLPMYDEGLTADFELPDVGNREMDLRERESRLSNFLTTINQELEAEGKDPVEWGEKPWMQSSMVQFGAEPPPPPDPPKPGDDEDDDDDKHISAQADRGNGEDFDSPFVNPWGGSCRR